MSNDLIFAGLDVSRETRAKLIKYVNLLEKENDKYNLVGQSTLADVWCRHILDSIQLQKYLDAGSLVDVGAGAGFPGMVLAIIGAESVALVDSVTKKINFLRLVSRETETQVDIIHDRVENIRDRKFDQITCRAFASLNKIFSLTENIKKTSTRYVLLKGEKYKEEIKEAEKFWNFTFKTQKSITDERGVILIIENICKRVHK
ncbi:MAG: 16S rRNA (guanine(527)-N(7))-methyltransferase RsmG [Rickettsiales bacterium]|nr:16S rRNA (guanine(527)-N(7))-methyltransferase RsmG [Rickettsiales bacterium]|tara:strand:+ start:70424 stop:71032 length:609 start_codon:yes stop_codon:yes gene_type:complete